MPNFLRNSLQHNYDLVGNYAHKKVAKHNLSLISGPCIWEKEIKTALSRVQVDDVNSYPVPAQDPLLLELLAEWEGVDASGIWLTPGADTAIEIVLTRCLGVGDRLSILSPNFPRFEIVGASIEGVDTVLFEDLSQIPDNSKVVAICSPNNPSTIEIPRTTLAQALRSNPDILFVVDAVFDWSGSYRVSSLCNDFENLIVLKSFSKIGLAGLRLGYLVTSVDLCDDVKTALSPFYVPKIIQMIGLEVAKNFTRVPEIFEIVDAEYSYLKSILSDSIERHTSTPFYLLKTTLKSSDSTEILFNKGFSVVDGSFFNGLPLNYLRVSISSLQINDHFISTLKDLKIL